MVNNVSLQVVAGEREQLTTGADGKTYQMLCIPLQFFPGFE